MAFRSMLSAALRMIRLALATVLLGGPALAAEYTFQECDRVEESTLRAELNGIAQRALAADGIAVEPIVERQWRQQELDLVIDREVSAAVAQVRQQEAYLSRLWSAWSPDKANDLATRVASAAFGSAGFQEAIGRLSESIAEAVATDMEQASIRSASSALGCLQAFIGGKYSENLLDVFATEIKTEAGNIGFADSATGDISLADMHSGALAGIGVIIGTQIAKRLMRRLAQRIAGRIVGRVVGRAAASMVPVVGWIAGAGLIAWDLWSGANGALPQIEESLTSVAVKDEIRKEIVDAVAPELENELPKVANEVANNIYSTWVEFKQQYQGVLELADRNPTFKLVLNGASHDDIYKLAKLVTVATEAVGRQQLEVELDHGRFQRLLAMPAGSLPILSTTKSFEQTIAWGELAGSHLNAVAELEIYKLRQPENLSKDSLAAIIAVGDRSSVNKLLLLQDKEREALFALPRDNLQTLAGRLPVEDLEWLAEYLRAIADLGSRNRLVARLLTQPAAMAELKSGGVKSALSGGADVDRTLDFVAAGPGVIAFFGHVADVANGEIGVSLFLHKYATPRNVAIVVGILAVWIGLKLWRHRARRPQQIIVQVPAKAHEEP